MPGTDRTTVTSVQSLKGSIVLHTVRADMLMIIFVILSSVKKKRLALLHSTFEDCTEKKSVLNLGPS